MKTTLMGKIFFNVIIVLFCIEKREVCQMQLGILITIIN